MNPGNLFIISAPSGAGKTTILKQVMSELERLVFSVSHTTRPPRANEVDGKDYHFVNRDVFKKMRAQGEFLEWAEVHRNFYGTSISSVNSHLADGVDVVLDIDVQGARQIREARGGDAVFIFIMPPSWDELENRLTGRGTDSRETINLRLNNAKKEMDKVDLYDYVIVNEKIDEAVAALRSIIIAERIRNRRSTAGLPITFPTSS
ncbi:MAG: guanylate kinase [Desulfobulbaceae bacterium]|nr:guanylate kinase [Desulfobulbaceae bacterium]